MKISLDASQKGDKIPSDKRGLWWPNGLKARILGVKRVEIVWLQEISAKIVKTLFLCCPFEHFSLICMIKLED
ncbi:hypothetical protein Brsp01_27640 [Brucella sp. NBRC 12950]|nr:hypothetical protein Brsp01_27640 [Brucella sp. NBRC 12950]